jgi:methylenetetrahydrofolate reductase (NADPH)
MALRGDLPPDAPLVQGDFPHAADLIRELKAAGGFCVGAACYPEGHIDCDDDFRDLVYLRDKQDAGADFLVTQLFFDNDIFFRYRERAAKQGIALPISAGIMPIFSQKQIERMIFMCGASLPAAIVRLLHRYENDPEALRLAGIDYAVGQIDSLIRGGVDGIHLYTMNQPLAAIQTMEHCRSLGLRRS